MEGPSVSRIEGYIRPRLVAWIPSPTPGVEEREREWPLLSGGGQGLEDPILGRLPPGRDGRCLSPSFEWMDPSFWHVKRRSWHPCWPLWKRWPRKRDGSSLAISFIWRVPETRLQGYDGPSLCLLRMEGALCLESRDTHDRDWSPEPLLHLLDGMATPSHSLSNGGATVFGMQRYPVCVDLIFACVEGMASPSLSISCMWRSPHSRLEGYRGPSLRIFRMERPLSPE